MKVTNTTSLQLASVADQGKSLPSGAIKTQVIGRKAVIGGGWITTLPVAAHARKQTGKAVIGGGWVTTTAVAAHVRRMAACASQRPSQTNEV